MSKLAHLESLLRARKLDGTVASARPLPANRLAQTGLADLDAHLGGGLPRGHLSEIVGPRSSGRASVMCAVLAAATSRGEVVALIDTFDSFDPASGEAAGIDLSRLLWIRGQHVTHRNAPRVITRAIKASGLVFQAGRFGIVVVDLAEAPLAATKRLPFTTWLRLSRAIEGSETVGLIVGPSVMGRSSAGRSIVLEPPEQSARWLGNSQRGRLFCGLEFDVRVESARQASTTLRLHQSTTDASRQSSADRRQTTVDR